VSKRSYRRLAAVTGAALALGSMAPAMAARVNANGTADVEVTDVTLPQLDISAATGLLTGVSGLAFSTVDATKTLAFSSVSGLQNDVTGIAGDLLDGGSLLSLNVGGNANVGLNALGAGVQVDGLAQAPLALVGNVVPTATGAVDTALDLAASAQEIASPIVETALTVPGTAIGLATGAPDLLFSLIDGTSLSANGNAGLGASLASIF